MFSVIIPLYNKAPYIEKAIRSVAAQTCQEFELIVIDDGSTDKTITSIQSLQNFTNTVHYVAFSRNFGKEAGLYAGLQHATGEYVAVMDVDLQDPPEMTISVPNTS